MLEEIGERERLFPCFVPLPHATGEMPPPEEFAAGVKARHGAVRLFPKSHRHSLSEWCSGRMPGALAERRVPALVEMAETTREEIAAVLHMHWSLPLVLPGTSSRIDRFIREAQGRVVGFKLHPSLHSASAAHAHYYPVFEYAQAREVSSLSHNWTGDPVDDKRILDGLAEAFPRVTFIIGHACGHVEFACRAALRRANVVPDTTGSGPSYDVIPEMARRVGAERILFGTDNPFIDPHPGLGRLLLARITDDQKRRILGLNAQRVFRL